MTQNSQAADNVIWGESNDSLLIGTDLNEEFGDDLGNDTAYGGAGDDYIGLGIGNDVHYGGAGNDSLFGGEDSDTLDGGAGNDVLYGYSAYESELYSDDLDGGVDVASYAAAEAAVSVDLSITAAQNTGGGGVDILSGMEGLIGSDYGDSLIGSSEDNLIYGGGGNDTVQTGYGSDTLFGGSGTNTLSLAGHPGDVRVDSA